MINEMHKTWSKAIINRDIETLMGLYDEKAILKPTLSEKIRTTPSQIKSYFTGGTDLDEGGFLNKDICEVDYTETNFHQSNGLGYDVGIYIFKNTKGEEVKAHFTYIYKMENGNPVKILAHHSSLP